MNDDAQLIETTLAGDSAAFGELVLKYQDRLFNTLLHIVGNAEDAQDVVQNTMVQAYLKLETFQGKSAFYTWLYRIAFNQAISFKRREKPTESIDVARELAGCEPIDHADPPEGRMLQEETVQQVRAALASLRDEHRTILVLREIDGCCYETISEILDLPVGTVRSRLHRARCQLREVLEQVLQAELG